MKNVKKITAVLLCAVMFICMFSVSVGAASSLSTVRSLKEGKTVSLINNTKNNKSYYYKITLTNGGTLTFSVGNAAVDTASKLTLINSAGKTMRTGSFSAMVKNEYQITAAGSYYIKLTLKPSQYITKFSYHFSGKVFIDGSYYDENTESLSLSRFEREHYGDDKLENSDIKDISRLKNLKYLDLSGNNLSDLTPLKELKKLEELHLYSNKFKDIRLIREFSYLKTLDIGGNDITSLAPLASMKNLKRLELTLSDNLTDLSGIKDIKGLEVLVAYNNKQFEFSTFKGSDSLKTADFSRCELKDITPLVKLKVIEELDLSNNKIKNISPLKNLTTLKILSLRNNDITDISALTSLKNLEYLSVDKKCLDISVLKKLTGLKVLDVKYLGLSESEIEELKKALPNCDILYEDPYEDWLSEKPVIYLYPEKTTDVSVKVDFKADDSFTCTYPEYNNGWRVTAQPDGTLTDENGKSYYCLYWESKGKTNGLLKYDNEGFCVKGTDTAEFLREKLLEIGLSKREANEFIIYWLPRMQDNDYNVITFHTDDYCEAVPMTVSPKPDSVIRVLMTYYPSSSYVDVTPQELPHYDRSGFTVVEWGGSELIRK